MNTADHILFLIKTRGPQTAQQLAQALGITSMGARRHLEAWAEKGQLTSEDRADKVGRPARHWLLTEAGHARFPDRHSELTVQLIAQVQTLFGDEGMERLISAREQQGEARYTQAMDKANTLRARVKALARLRDEEGYMAEVDAQPDGSFLLTEHHCPICAAATQCQVFCRSELSVFQRTLGPSSRVERVEHLLAGGARCVYRITPV